VAHGQRCPGNATLGTLAKRVPAPGVPDGVIRVPESRVRPLPTLARLRSGSPRAATTTTGIQVASDVLGNQETAVDRALSRQQPPQRRHPELVTQLLSQAGIAGHRRLRVLAENLPRLEAVPAGSLRFQPVGQVRRGVRTAQAGFTYLRAINGPLSAAHHAGIVTAPRSAGPHNRVAAGAPPA
jgi:hypothetical protein